MSSFQRMIAIPQEEYMSMNALQKVDSPSLQQFSQLENRYVSDENIHDPYRRLVMQSSTLDEMKQLKEQMRNSLSIATPKPYRNRAQALLNSIDSFIRYNEKGEIYSDDNKVIPGSRVEDLINHSVRDRRRNMTPTGWTHFKKLLRDHNIPKTILNRNTLDELDEKLATSLLPVKTPSPALKVKAKQSRIPTPRASKTIAKDFLKHFKE